MNGFVSNFKQNPIKSLNKVALSLSAGAFLSLCLLSYGSILFIWQTSDPGCVCYSQRIYMSRGRFENMRQLFDTAFFILAPILSFLFFKLSEKLSLPLRKSFLIALLTSTIALLSARAIFNEDIPQNYYQFIMVGKIMAYHYGEFARIFVQPMFSWAFIGSLLVFVLTFITSLLLMRKSSP